MPVQYKVLTHEMSKKVGKDQLWGLLMNIKTSKNSLLCKGTLTKAIKTLIIVAAKKSRDLQKGPNELQLPN
jgi:hypothetical protein